MVQAIIMAGGEGSRLRPLTCDRPKPMVPVLNRPVMEYAVELLKKHGITDIGVTLQYMPEEIINHFREGSDYEVNMNYFIEEKPLGTAGSVKNAQEFIKETFIVVSGDALTDFNLSEALEFHRAKKSLVTLVLTPVEVPLEYGVVITEKTGQIRQFLEKPGWGELFSDTVNTGIYIMEPEILKFIPEGVKYDFSKDLFPFILKEQMPLFGVSLNGYWCDIGNHKQYQEAHFDCLKGKVAVQLQGGQLNGGLLNGDPRRGGALKKDIFIGRNCRIDETAVINGPVLIGDNCSIGKGVVLGPYAVLGNNCIIDNGASLKRSLIWNGTYIGKFAEVRGAVLCNRVTVQDRAMIFEGAVIGDGCTIEGNARIRPETRVWPHKTVERSTVLNDHLIWGNTACRNLFGSDGVSGRVNVNLTPECAAKLGAVFGTVQGTDLPILISSDQLKGTKMIKIAVQAGLMSVGVDVIDGGDLLTPVHRYAVKAAGVGGGVHIKSSGVDHEVVQITFFSSNGAAISRDLERKIENLFEREDFTRTNKQNVGVTTYMPGLTDAYISSLCKSVDADKIKKNKYRVFICSPANVQETAIKLFAAIGCEVMGCETIGGSESDISGTAALAATEVTRSNASFGAVIDNNAEQVILIDETGRVIRGEEFQALMSLAVLETAQQPVVAIPVTGSSVVEIMARARQGKVIRTKTSAANFEGEILREDLHKLQGALNQSVIMFDALSSLVKLISFMSGREIGLKEILSQIPDIYMTQKETDCPWAVKGKVMRQLIEDTAGDQVELIDGIKVFHKKGWALVLPDAELPKYKVYSEGHSYELAESLADFYIDKINQLKMS
ncbi:MAG: sugar phosphate nucleotidyltransferase [Thermincola sp.]|nr:sugar phosphate nucleotidyltransferase [Thermincola sp.]